MSSGTVQISNDVLVWLVPLFSAVAAWVVSRMLKAAQRDGEAKALAEAQRASTGAIHRRLDECKAREDLIILELERIKEALLSKGIVTPRASGSA